MDIEALEFRAACLQAARNFFITHQYLELDTPALSSALIPESCLEVFRTEYLKPFKTGEEAAVPLFLVPSPEVFIKPVIAAHGRSVFQLSKCYRNCESVGHIHNPEFTMLEYYTMQADCRDSIKITEAFLQTMAQAVAGMPLADPELGAVLSKPFLQLTMDEAFKRFAGFSLAEAETPELAFHAERLGLGDRAQYESWAWDDLYELLLVHCIEPQLPSDVPVALLDYPARVPALHRNGRNSVPPLTDGHIYGRQKSGGKCMYAEWSWQTAIPKHGMREKSTALLQTKQQLKTQRRGFRIPYRRTSAGYAPVCPPARASRWALTA